MRSAPSARVPIALALSLPLGALAACGSGSSGSPAPAGSATVTTAAVTATLAPAPPQKETWLLVTSPAAPLLGELEDDDPPEEVIRQGELVQITKEMRQFHWDAKMDGKDDKREGLAVEVRYAMDGAHKYGFKPDFGAEITVPATSWLCDEISKQGSFDRARCPGLLRRAKTADGALLVYAACSSGTCPVAVVKDDKVSVLAVENLTTGWFFTGKKRSVLMVAARWVKDNGQQSGGALFPIVIENGTLKKGEETPIDTVDARDPKKSFARLVHATVLPDGITLEGEETTKDAEGKTLSTKKIQEKKPLPSLD
ncbi:MAG: hypothetical protein U0441_33330 [Polyangiaceae bacterium]